MAKLKTKSRPRTQAKAVAQYVAVMRFFCGLYAVGGVLFYSFHSLMTHLMQIPGSLDHYWVSLATAMMAMLSYLSWLASTHPHERSYVEVHVLAKCVSVVGFLLGLALDHGLVAYYGCAALDASVIFVVVRYYRRANAGVEPAAVA